MKSGKIYAGLTQFSAAILIQKLKMGAQKKKPYAKHNPRLVSQKTEEKEDEII
jgi:hypothetical protein